MQDSTRQNRTVAEAVASFGVFYNETLRPVLQSFDDERRRNLKKAGKFAGVVLAVSLVVGAIGGGAWWIGVPIAVLLSLAGFPAFRGDWAVRVKMAVMPRVLDHLSPGLTYDPISFVGQDGFVRSRLCTRRIDRYRGEDCVQGAIGATQVMFSEIHAEHREEYRDAKGRRHTRWITLFRGLFFVGDFNKHFDGVTVVVPDVAERMLGSWLGNLLQKANFAQSGALVKLEDPEFEKVFAVYGDDQVEARYILTPALMRRLLDFRRRTGREISVSFAESCVFVAVSQTRDLFEPRMFGSLLDPTWARAFFDDVAMAVGIVEDLNLNTRIWTKT